MFPFLCEYKYILYKEMKWNAGAFWWINDEHLFKKKMKMESFLILGRIKLIIGDLNHLILEESLSG